MVVDIFALVLDSAKDKQGTITMLSEAVPEDTLAKVRNRQQKGLCP